jgi:hypothetical protein
MAFTPISLPIQQILMTNFVTDIATITNANTLLLQAKLEDLINNLEIDTSTLSIGTTTPITYIKTQSVIIEDQSLVYQTGSPTPVIIASLTKNGSNESIFQVDRLITNIDASFSAVTLNTLLLNTSAIFNGSPVFNTPITINSSVIESKESIVSSLTWSGTLASPATTTVTLTSTSKQNIFITLQATAAPTANAVYNGASIAAGINEFQIIFDFDLTSPPLPNTKFTIYIVDVIEASASSSITSPVQLATIPIKYIAGTNLNTTNSIILHNNVNNVGIPSTVTFNQYGTNVTFDYILDSNNDDRLVVSSTVGASIF